VDKTPLEDLIRDLAKRIETQLEVSEQRFRMGFEGLHPKIEQGCRIHFEKGEFDDAIFNAVNVVEEEIRAKMSADSTGTGAALISKVMNPQVPILSFSKVNTEQEAASALYRGAIGWFKSAIGHRFLDTTDPAEAFECLAIGSLLMRILDRAT